MIFISTHTTGIAAMFKHIFVSGLTFASILFVTATSTHAKLARNADFIAIKNVVQSTAESSVKNVPQRQIASNSQKSMEYFQLGWDAQTAGDNEVALRYYYRAIQLDETNAVAFLATGTLLGETDDGIICVKAAALLFHAQGNQEGYDLATTWLTQRGISE
jgi:cytochrome c-type biogenesis protein CcmH/NrfG